MNEIEDMTERELLLYTEALSEILEEENGGN